MNSVHEIQTRLVESQQEYPDVKIELSLGLLLREKTKPRVFRESRFTSEEKQKLYELADKLAEENLSWEELKLRWVDTGNLNKEKRYE